MIKNDKANINKMTSKRDIKNKSFFNGVKYSTLATAGMTGKKVNVKKLNDIIEKDWAKNKVQIVKGTKTQRRWGKATVASALAIYGGLGGSISASVGTTKLATSKLARRIDGYADAYYHKKR